jgi:hypothetical protein
VEVDSKPRWFTGPRPAKHIELKTLRLEDDQASARRLETLGASWQVQQQSTRDDRQWQTEGNDKLDATRDIERIGPCPCQAGRPPNAGQFRQGTGDFEVWSASGLERAEAES